MRRAALLLALSLVACKKPAASGAPDGGTGTAVGSATVAAAAAGAAPSTQAAEAPPADVPAFLARFCERLAREDRPYFDAHTRLKDYSSEQGPDPDAPPAERGRKSWSAGPQFAGTCKRIGAQPPGELAKRVREENGVILVRLRGEGKASDSLIERNGADYLLIREDPPGANAKKQKPARGGSGGGGHHGGHDDH